MGVMRTILAAFLIGLTVPLAGAAYAQVGYQPPGMQPVIPYPTAPAPIPPPRIEVPAVPQMSNPPPFALQNTTPGVVTQDKPPKQVLKSSRRRNSYGDRVARCLDEAAALGYGPNGRAAYSRSCANQ
ncbi:hypothetical protein [Bradyrhizobium sp. SYSU BS000235]|uniref:hypothetical protein n=1 Tax=Bradyrhizobium sp. SYSU BS000235 TaxID=3411332 RepID=UPI003C73FD9B